MTEHELTPLCKLARYFQTDKGGWHLHAGDTCHNYTPAYYELFKDRQQTVKRVLEIGVNYGPSLRMWREFFPNAEIVGLDCNEQCLFNDGRIRCFAADQGNAESLLDAMERAGINDRYDLIIDDGSHFPAHQLLSAQVLMPFLEFDGVYVIEDIDYDCQPELIMDKLPHYKCEAINTGVGLGKAHCHPDCTKCHGAEGERLIVVRHG